MKKILFLSLFLTACNPPTTPDAPPPNIIVITTGNSGGVDQNCASVDRVVLKLPDSLGVGSTAKLDATPKDNLGQPRSDSCNEASGIVWTSNSDTCTLSNYTSFIPNVLGVRAGSCVVSATVSGVSNSGSFPVK